MSGELLVGVTEAARRLGVGRSKAYELVASGELRAVSIGARKLVPVFEVERYYARLLDAAGITPERGEAPG